MTEEASSVGDLKEPPSEELLRDLEPGEEATAGVKGGCGAMAGSSGGGAQGGKGNSTSGGGSTPKGLTFSS